MAAKTRKHDASCYARMLGELASPYSAKGNGPAGPAMSMVNAGPHLPGELAEMFATADVDTLSRAWVAVTVDALTTFKFSEGDIARALVVVAHRLCRSEIPRVPLILPPAPPDAPQPSRTIPMPRQPDEQIKACFKVCDGPAPVKKKGSRGMDPLNMAILALQPGKHLQIDSNVVKKTALDVRVKKLKEKNGLDESVGTYTAQNGLIIVQRPAGEAAA